MSTKIDPLTLLDQSSQVYSAEMVDQAILAVAKAINQHHQHDQLVLLCVMTGGLFFCGKLLSLLTMPVELDYVQANRYHHDLTGGSLTWTKTPALSLHNRTVLIVDDILDEGITLEGVRQTCLSLGAKSVKTAVLCNKNNQALKPLRADYVALTVPDAFVFGCGMDAYGWWRNLPEIRAIDSV